MCALQMVANISSFYRYVFAVALIICVFVPVGIKEHLLSCCSLPTTTRIDSVSFASALAVSFVQVQLSTWV